jgi:hypothetical protein
MTYYDHAKNHRRPAQAHAIAAAARDSKADGTAYTVTFTNRLGSTGWWAGAQYDALSLAKDLARNGFSVTLTSPTGLVRTADEIKTARF